MPDSEYDPWQPPPWEFFVEELSTYRPGPGADEALEVVQRLGWQGHRIENFALMLNYVAGGQRQLLASAVARRSCDG